MVPLIAPNASTALTRRDDIVRSADRAVGRLLRNESDPLALALYLRVMRDHDLVLINGDRLVAWAATWVRRILVDGHIGRRRDMDIASAALAATGLHGTDTFASLESGVRERLGRVVSDELDVRPVPFRSAPYGAIVLYAISFFGIKEPRVASVADALTTLYDSAFASGRMFGIGFVIRLLSTLGRVERIKALAERARHALDDPRTGYEDRVYLLEALWAAAPVIGTNGIADLSELIVPASPGLLYIDQGVEEVTPAEDDWVAITVSDLYRAELLDVVLHTEKAASARILDRLDERYRGRRVVTVSAFGFYFLIIVMLWVALLVPLIVAWPMAHRYWIDQQFGSLSAWGASLYALDIAVITIAVPCTKSLLTGLWNVLVRSQVESDRRVRDLFWRSLADTITQWNVWFVGAIVVAIIVSVGFPGLVHLAHLFSKK